MKWVSNQRSQSQFSSIEVWCNTFLNSNSFHPAPFPCHSPLFDLHPRQCKHSEAVPPWWKVASAAADRSISRDCRGTPRRLRLFRGAGVSWRKAWFFVSPCQHEMPQDEPNSIHPNCSSNMFKCGFWTVAVLPLLLLFCEWLEVLFRINAYSLHSFTVSWNLWNLWNLHETMAPQACGTSGIQGFSKWENATVTRWRRGSPNGNFGLVTRHDSTVKMDTGRYERTAETWRVEEMVTTTTSSATKSVKCGKTISTLRYFEDHKYLPVLKTAVLNRFQHIYLKRKPLLTLTWCWQIWTGSMSPNPICMKGGHIECIWSSPDYILVMSAYSSLKLKQNPHK